MLIVHGVWDAESKNIGPYIAPHTNITEIDLGLDLLWRAGITPAKVVLGQGWVSQTSQSDYKGVAYPCSSTVEASPSKTHLATPRVENVSLVAAQMQER